jgi:cell division protein FtsI/penicillin-binding protein 2
MAFGYGVSVTPMQTLAFYNAVANNGVMVILSEIKEWNKTIVKWKGKLSIQNMFRNTFKVESSFKM